MRGKNTGGAPVDAAPISRFATDLTRGPSYRLCNTLHRGTARLRFVVASERETRLFVTDRTNLKLPKQRLVRNRPVIINRARTGTVNFGILVCAWMFSMKDATKSLRRLEIRSVAPAVGRFAALANTFPRPTAFEGVLAFKAVTRFSFVNALWFWFHCWFSHNHTLAYGRVFVNHMLTIILKTLLLTDYAVFQNRLGELEIFHHIKQCLAIVSLAVFLNISPAAGADMASGLAAVKKGDYETALKEWLPLAKEGNPSAQYNIGQLYRLGRGVSKDYTKASQWYEKAAEMRHSAARHNLAVLYEKGLGVPIDYAKALDWYEKAANQDYGIAQFNLAVMYSVGQGTKRDLVKAYTWYAIAADRDIDGAAENSDQIAKLMTKDQLKEALERAREWIDWRK